MIQYLIEVSIAWFVFYSIYLVFFKRETFFAVNRWYLVHTLIIGLILPFVKNLPAAFTREIPTFYTINFMDSEIISLSGMEVNEAVMSSFNLNTILAYIYLVGVIVGTIRLIYGLKRIQTIWRNSDKKRMGAYVLVISERVKLPFSFLNQIYVNKAFLEMDQFREILQHELTHVKHRHTYDVLFMQTLCILFWWNPIIYLYKRELKETHEYMADAEALSQSDLKNYGQILLGHNSSGIELALTHQFFSSHLKNRLNMLYKKKSAWKNLLRYTLIIPCFLGLLILFTSQTVISESNEQLQKSSGDVLEMINNFTGSEALDSDTILYQKKKDYQKGDVREIIEEFVTRQHFGADTIPEVKGKVYQEVDVMPIFPECNKSFFTDKESQLCSRNKLIDFVFSNIKYPEAAFKEKVEGMVIAQFVVSDAGKINDIKIVRDIGKGCGEEAIRVINSMNEELGNWKPGIKDGNAVSVVYTLPIKFDLGESSTRKEAQQTKQSKKAEFMQNKKSDFDLTDHLNPEAPETFIVVEQMPRFPGCEDLYEASEREKENCAKEKMLTYIYKNVKYPQAAEDEGIEGMTVVQFVVAEDGSIRDCKIVRDIGAGCGAEAKRVAESMNNMTEKWIPGKQRGRPIKVLYTLPVKFKLD